MNNTSASRYARRKGEYTKSDGTDDQRRVPGKKRRRGEFWKDKEKERSGVPPATASSSNEKGQHSAAAGFGEEGHTEKIYV